MKTGAVVACAIVACATPSPPRSPAVPTMAGDARTLSICWRTQDTQDGSMTERMLRSALHRHLESAGYVLHPASCDVSLTVTWSISDGEFRSVRVGMRDANDRLIAPIALSFAAGEISAFDTDQLATAIVNQMNASEPLASLGRKREEARAISFKPEGVTVRDKQTSEGDVLDVEAVRKMYSVPPRERVDVTIEPHAPWASVVEAFDLLLTASQPHIRLHARGQTVDLDLTNQERWLGRGTWLGVGLSATEVVGRWRTDKPCESAPPSFSDSFALEAMADNVAKCASGCLDRLVIGGLVVDSGPYLDAMLVASRALRAPVPLDVHGAYWATPQCGGTAPDLFVAFENRKSALHECAPHYHGVVRAVVELDHVSAVRSVTVLFLDQPSVPDAAKTCAARALERGAFPADQRGKRVVHTYDL